MVQNMNKKSNINIRIDDDLLEQIDQIQMEYFFSSRSETIRFLAVYGIRCLDLSDSLLKKEAENKNKDNEK